MTPAFVLFSDPHLGRAWGAHAVPLTRDKLTEKYALPFNEIRARYPSTPKICGGDLFDRAHNNEKLIHQAMLLAVDVDFILAGNHDHASRESALTSLQLMARSGTEGIVMAEDHLNRADAQYEQIGGVGVYLVPHHATQALFEEAVYDCLAHAKEDSGPKVMVVHANHGPIGGGKPDSSLYVTPQLEAAIHQHVDLLFLGHEHLPRKIGKTYIMGSTQPCNFGELGPRFCYEIHRNGSELLVKQQELATTMTSATYSAADIIRCGAAGGATELVADLVTLDGTAPMAMTRQVQRLVKDFFAAGALAVRMNVEWQQGEQTGAQVSGSMRNLLDVVRGEIKDNEPWTLLLEEALVQINEGKQ